MLNPNKPIKQILQVTVLALTVMTGFSAFQYSNTLSSTKSSFSEMCGVQCRPGTVNCSGYCDVCAPQTNGIYICIQ